jgi:HNH endonuclease
MAVLRHETKAEIWPYTENPNRRLKAGERVLLFPRGQDIMIVHEGVSCRLALIGFPEVEVISDNESGISYHCRPVKIKIVSSENIFIAQMIPKSGLDRFASWFKGEPVTEVRPIVFDSIIVQMDRVYLETISPPKDLKVVSGFDTIFRDEDHQDSPIRLACDYQSDIKKVQRISWLYQGKVYSTLEDLTADEVKALVHEAGNKAKAKVGRAVALMKQVEVMEKDSETGRQPISDEVKMFVWRRDEGKCVKCGSNQKLEFDHIIPVVMGGSNTSRNLQLLCEGCNRAKGGSLV